ncbi:MAG: class I SAM-dependent methyltransferase [Myxococcota bacterium]
MNSESRFWDDLAESYAKKPVEDPAAFERKIELTKERLRPSDVVLDIGCGTGSLALRLASSAAEVHGLDISKEMIRIAKAKAVEAQADNVHFRVGPFDRTLGGFDPGSLDCICAYSIIHLVKDRDAALAQMWKLLRPGGTLVSSTVVLGASWIPFGPIIWTMRQFGKAPWVAIMKERELVSDLARAGFVDIETPDVGAKSTVAFVIARRPE